MIRQLSFLLVIIFFFTMVLGGSGWGNEIQAKKMGSEKLKLLYSAPEEDLNKLNQSVSEESKSKKQHLALFNPDGDRPFELLFSIAGAIVLFNPVADIVTEQFKDNIGLGILLGGALIVGGSYALGKLFLSPLGSIVDDKVFGKGKGPRLSLSALLPPEPKENSFKNKKDHWAIYEGWIVASSTTSPEANMGEYIYLKRNVYMSEHPNPKTGRDIENSLLLNKGLRGEVLEKREITDRFLIFREYTTSWFKIMTPEIHYSKYLKGDKDWIRD